MVAALRQRTRIEKFECRAAAGAQSQRGQTSVAADIETPRTELPGLIGSGRGGNRMDAPDSGAEHGADTKRVCRRSSNQEIGMAPGVFLAVRGRKALW